MAADDSKPTGLAKTWQQVKGATNIAKTFLIAQSDSVSDAVARHQAKLAHIDVCKTLAESRIASCEKAHAVLLERYISSTDEIERFQIERDLQFVDERQRLVTVARKAIDYLPEPTAPESENETESSQKNEPDTTDDISSHWLDTFNNLAKIRNENWRQELFSRSLAAEATRPGFVTTRALWMIGTLEQKVFKAFACYLDMSCWCEGPIVPHLDIDKHQQFWKQEIPDCDLGANITLGSLSFILTESGLVASGDSGRTFSPGDRFLVGYGEESHEVEVTGQARVDGWMTTDVGLILSCFHDLRPNSLGKSMYDEWIREFCWDSSLIVRDSSGNVVSKTPRKGPPKFGRKSRR